MQDAHFERLVGCFQRVFPNLNAADIPAATHENVADWDSLHQITLLSLLGEEFGIDIDFEEFEQAASFSSILDFVRARTVDA